MRYIKETYTSQLEVNKSKFIGILIPITSVEMIKEKIEELKVLHPKANHYTFACICGLHGEQQLASDDGEPQRTAGIPILEVLKHHDLTDVLAVVIRYFGGIKLGAGGLVRAYTKTIADTIKTVIFYQKKEVMIYSITLPYALLDTFEFRYKEKVTVLEKLYQEHVTLKCRLNDCDLSIFDDIKHQLIEVKSLGSETLFVLEA